MDEGIVGNQHCLIDKGYVVESCVAKIVTWKVRLPLWLLGLPVFDPVHSVDQLCILIVDAHQVRGVLDGHVLIKQLYELDSLLVANFGVCAFSTACHLLLVGFLIKHLTLRFD